MKRRLPSMLATALAPEVCRRASRLLGILAVSATLGCASAPRPVPTGGQPSATVEGAGLALTVPRLEPAAYPDDVLELATPVFVAIENKGQTEIEIAVADFSLSGAGGMSYAPLQPQQLAQRLPEHFGPPAKEEALASLLAEGQPVYAQRFGGGRGSFGGGFRGGSFGGVRAAPAYRGGSFGGRGYVPAPAPAYRGGFSAPRGWGYGYRGYAGSRGGWGYRGGPRVWVGPGLGYGYGYGWGSSWWGYGPYAPYWWWGQDSYVRSRDDITRYALAAGKLPPGGRIAGFLYFPHQAMPQSGGALLLRWQARDATSRNVIADMRVQLDVNDE